MARANRVIQKPKPPVVKHLAIIDPNTGVISGYASGTNIVIGPVESKRNWTDITDIPGSEKLSAEKIKRIFIKDGKVRRKPRVRLIIDAKRIEIGRGRAKVSFEVLEGEVSELNLLVISNGTVRKEKLIGNQTLDIGGSSRRKVTVEVDDPLIFVEGHVAAVDIVPSEELIIPPTPSRNDVDDLVIEKKDKKNNG